LEAVLNHADAPPEKKGRRSGPARVPGPGAKARGRRSARP
jgi:hypothetical protein